jgi:succinate dehydrogenase/fumarate reductase cytochrome b subunit
MVFMPLWVGFKLAQHHWFLSVELADGVTIKQRPFEDFYDIHTRKGEIIQNVDAWIIRSNYVYGSCLGARYFMIDLGDLYITRFPNLDQINKVLVANQLPLYRMSDEESTADLKYDGGRNRKYAK